MKTRLDDGPPDSIIWHKNRLAPTGIIIRATVQGKYVASFGEETRAAETWAEIIAWLTHHGEKVLKS